jgi:MFS family permease
MSEARPRSPLRQRSLAALITAEVISSLGSHMTFLALPWFVLATTGSAAKMGVVLAVELAPVALLGIPSGTVVSRLGARRTMLYGDLARAPLMASIPLLHAAGWLSFGVLLVIVSLIGVFLAPYFAAQRLVLPELVGEDEQVVAQANAVVEGAQRAAALLGPALAGVLIAAFGATTVLYVDAATFLVAFVILAVFVPQKPPLPASGEGKGLLAGVRFVLHDRMLATLGATALFANAFGQMLSAGLPVLAYTEFGASSRIAGVFFAAFGAGAVAGSIAAMKLVPRYEPIRLGAVSFVLLSIPIWLLALDLPAWGVVLVLFASSFFGPLVNAPLIGVITTRTPEALRAKVMTAVITTAMLAGPIGMLVAGQLLEAWGPHQVFLLVAAGQLAATIPFAAVAFRRPAGPGPAEPEPAG